MHVVVLRLLFTFNWSSLKVCDVMTSDTCDLVMLFVRACVSILTWDEFSFMKLSIGKRMFLYRRRSWYTAYDNDTTYGDDDDDNDVIMVMIVMMIVLACETIASCVCSPATCPVMR